MAEAISVTPIHVALLVWRITWTIPTMAYLQGYACSLLGWAHGVLHLQSAFTVNSSTGMYFMQA